MTAKPSFTVGIEEEYMLVDRETRNTAINPPREIFDECADRSKTSAIEHELLRSQIEVETRVCKTIAEAREDLARMRKLTCEVAAKHNIAPIAASTHPFAAWQEQEYTDKERYHLLYRDMQALAHRLLICGMHVHVGIEDNDLRVALLNRFAAWLPLVLALSTSSPFWEGENTGLKSFRLTVFDNFPRSGLPEQFSDYADYEKHVEILKQAGVLKDATFIWWNMRISARYPTLECRIADVCTRLDDATAIAALIQSLLHYLYRMQTSGTPARVYPRFLVKQNRWRAMRYGIDEGLIDFDHAKIIPVRQILADLVETVYPDARELGCERELSNVLEIPERGTSAHRQLAVYDSAVAEGKSRDEALCDVVDFLVQQTAEN